MARYGMHTEEGDDRVGVIVDIVVGRAQRSLQPIDQAFAAAVAELEKISVSPEYEEACDSVVRDAVLEQLRLDLTVTLERRYHVPRSQVWVGSRGRQQGAIHYHVTARTVVGRIVRRPGRALCDKQGWYERPVDADDLERFSVCTRCGQIADRIPNKTIGD